MTEIDVFGFSKFKIFDSIKEHLPVESREIVDVFEDLLFVWNFKENVIQVVNWRNAQNAFKEGQSIKIQVIESNKELVVDVMNFN
jgi:hypothetical protein